MASDSSMSDVAVLTPEPVSITDELRASFRDYSMSVIVGRALPNVHDGLKPVHRRILYAMHKEGLVFNRKYSKCAGVVGEVLKHFHPHGDAPVYEALARMAQPWNMRALLVDGQGNFGSVDGDPPAAYRYTEARLARIAHELLRDIDKATVDFVPNFDGTVPEPVVLPARFPNLLVNGSEGIAVAMATRVPPHNLGEVIDGLLAIIAEQYEEGPVVDADALLRLVPGPDFPTGGIIRGTKGCRDAAITGRGSVVVRGCAQVEESKDGKRKHIVIDQIPYQVNKTRLLEQMAGLVRDKRIDGITDLRDESDRDGMRVVVDVRRDCIPEVILNQLYQYTMLQTSYPAHMLAIVNGQPRTLGLREVLEEFLAFRREVITRRSRFELTVAQQRFHTVSGLLVALDDIDRVVSIIRSCTDTQQAKKRLQEQRFEQALKVGLLAQADADQLRAWRARGYAQLDEQQAAAILEMRLSRLVGLERDKLMQEGEELLAQMQRLRHILNDVGELMRVIKSDLIEVRKQFATPRRTQIEAQTGVLGKEDLIAQEDVLVTVSHGGYVKRCALSHYRAQHRGGKGKQAVTARDEDFIADAFVASTHAYLLVFTDAGKVYWVKVYELPDAGPSAKGRPIVNLARLEGNEKVRSVLPVRAFPKQAGEAFVVTCSRNGKVKKTDLLAYARPRSNGLIACGIESGDELVEVKIANGEQDILITTRAGMAIRFAQSDVRACGRAAMGVRGISLRNDDYVVSMDVLDARASILTVTEFGHGKRTAVSEYRTQNRAGMGLITIKADKRNGAVAGALQVYDKDQVMIVTDQGRLIRLTVNSVSRYSRNTKGVRLITMDRKSKERVIALARLAESDDVGEDGKES
ncbi:MAG: DNA gyrase subunit A [Myxococcota bacterium]